MLIWKSIVPLLIVLLHGLAALAQTSSDWRELVEMLPASANAVLAIDAKSLFDSPLAQKEQWRKAHDSQFDRNLTMLPPDADRFVLTADLDIEHFEPKWEFAAMKLKQPASVTQIRGRTGGQADILAGRKVIRTDRGSFIVPSADGRVAVLRLAPRQWASREIRRLNNQPTAQVHSFLEAAIAEVTGGSSQISMAVLLEDAIPPAEIRTALKRSAALQASDATVADVADIMASIQGFVFSVQVTNTIHARLQMVFLQEPTPLDPVAKPFIVELLSGAGATLPEFAEWKASRAPMRIGIEGRLTGRGLWRVLSLLSVDSHEVESRRPQDAVMGRDTFQYVRRVSELVRDITSNAKSRNLREQVLWTDRCAKSVSRLPTRYVEPEVAGVGRDIASDLHRIVSTFHHAADDANARASAATRPAVELVTEIVPYSFYKTPYGLFYRYSPFNYARINIRGNAIRRRQVTNEEVTKANNEAKHILSGVENKVAKMNEMIGTLAESAAR